MDGFLALCSGVARGGIRHNHGSVAEKVGSEGSLVQKTNQRALGGELRSRLGEPAGYADQEANEP
jgi:hypothetical protein